jgi:hypothetical protein
MIYPYTILKHLHFYPSVMSFLPCNLIILNVDQPRYKSSSTLIIHDTNDPQHRPCTIQLCYITLNIDSTVERFYIIELSRTSDVITCSSLHHYHNFDCNRCLRCLRCRLNPACPPHPRLSLFLAFTLGLTSRHQEYRKASSSYLGSFETRSITNSGMRNHAGNRYMSSHHQLSTQGLISTTWSCIITMAKTQRT